VALNENKLRTKVMGKHQRLELPTSTASSVFKVLNISSVLN